MASTLLERIVAMLAKLMNVVRQRAAAAVSCRRLPTGGGVQLAKSDLFQ